MRPSLLAPADAAPRGPSVKRLRLQKANAQRMLDALDSQARYGVMPKGAKPTRDADYYKGVLWETERALRRAQGLAATPGAPYRFDPSTALRASRTPVGPRASPPRTPVDEWVEGMGGSLLRLAALGNGPLAPDETLSERAHRWLGAAADTANAVTAAPRVVRRQLSDDISGRLGNGAIDPSLYETDVPSRVAGHLADFGDYLIPGAAPILMSAQAASLSAQLLDDPKRAAVGLYDGVAPWTAKTPEEAVLRTLALVGGAAHLGVRGRGYVEAIRKGRAPDPALVAQVVRESNEIARKRGVGQTDRLRKPSKRLAPNAMGGDARRTAHLDNDAARTQGPPKLIGGESAPDASLVMPSGEALVRDLEDAAHLDAMRREFGPIAGLAKYVEGRFQESASVPVTIETPTKPRGPLPKLLTGEPAPHFPLLDEYGKPIPADKVTPRPHGRFNPLHPEEQFAAREAAESPVRIKVASNDTSYMNFRRRSTAWLEKQRQVQKTTGGMDAPALGGKVLVSSDGITKLYKGDRLSQMIVPHIPEILRAAKLVYHEELKRGNAANLQMAARLVARVETDMGPRDVWMLVRKARDGNFYYHHQHTEVLPVGGNPSGVPLLETLRPSRAIHSTPKIEVPASVSPKGPPPSADGRRPR